MNGKQALIFYTSRSSFVKKDIDILAEDFTVLEHNFYSKEKWQTPLKFLSQLLFLLGNIGSSQIIVCQFAGYHSFLPSLFGKIFGRPCIVIVGGTDAHYFPGIGYGNWQKTVLKMFTAWSFRLCAHIAPKHKSLMLSDYNYDSNEPNKQGIYARLSDLKTPYTEIENGYDSVKWKCTGEKRKNSFITVSGGWEYPFQAKLKGIDLILKAAPSFPDCEFAILGVPDAGILGALPANVKILAPLKNEALPTVFSEYRFYLQLSMAEGFPNSLCEAMLCECVPIGSEVFSIPEIIGDSGFVLHKRDVTALEKLIQSALQATNLQARGQKAREIIANKYKLEFRKEKLQNLCRQLIST